MTSLQTCIALSTLVVAVKLKCGTEITENIIEEYMNNPKLYEHVEFAMPSPRYNEAVQRFGTVYRKREVYRFYHHTVGADGEASDEENIVANKDDFYERVDDCKHCYVFVTIPDMGMEVSSQYGFMSHSSMELTKFLSHIAYGKTFLKELLTRFQYEDNIKYEIMNMPKSWEHS